MKKDTKGPDPDRLRVWYAVGTEHGPTCVIVDVSAEEDFKVHTDAVTSPHPEPLAWGLCLYNTGRDPNKLMFGPKKHAPCGPGAPCGACFEASRRMWLKRLEAV